MSWAMTSPRWSMKHGDKGSTRVFLGIKEEARARHLRDSEAGGGAPAGLAAPAAQRPGAGVWLFPGATGVGSGYSDGRRVTLQRVR